MTFTNRLCSMQLGDGTHGLRSWFAPTGNRLPPLSCWSSDGTVFAASLLGGRRPAGRQHTFREGTLTPELSKVAYSTAGLRIRFLKLLLPSSWVPSL